MTAHSQQELFRALTEGSSVATRVGAAIELGARRRIDSIEPLARALYDGDTAVTRAAAHALVRLADREADTALLLGLEAEDSVANEVADVMREHSPILERRLCEIADSHEDARVRALGAAALAYPVFAIDSLQLLEEIARSDIDGDVREAAQDAVSFLASYLDSD